MAAEPLLPSHQYPTEKAVDTAGEPLADDTPLRVGGDSALARAKARVAGLSKTKKAIIAAGAVWMTYTVAHTSFGNHHGHFHGAHRARIDSMDQDDEFEAPHGKHFHAHGHHGFKDFKHEPVLTEAVYGDAIALTSTDLVATDAEGYQAANATFPLSRRRLFVDFLEGAEGRVVISRGEAEAEPQLIVESVWAGMNALDNGVQLLSEGRRDFLTINATTAVAHHTLHLVVPAHAKFVHSLHLSSADRLLLQLHETASDIRFKHFSASAPTAIDLPAIVGKAIEIDTKGPIHGSFNVSKELVLKTVVGDINATVHVVPPHKHNGNWSHHDGEFQRHHSMFNTEDAERMHGHKFHSDGEEHEHRPHHGKFHGKHHDEEHEFHGEDVEHEHRPHHGKFHGKHHDEEHEFHGEDVEHEHRPHHGKFHGKHHDEEHEFHGEDVEHEHRPHHGKFHGKHHQEEEDDDVRGFHTGREDRKARRAHKRRATQDEEEHQGCDKAKARFAAKGLKSWFPFRLFAEKPEEPKEPNGPKPHPTLIKAFSATGSIDLHVHQPPFISSVVVAKTHTGNVKVFGLPFFRGFFEASTFVGNVDVHAGPKEIKIIEEHVGEAGRLIKGLVKSNGTFPHHHNGTFTHPPHQDGEEFQGEREHAHAHAHGHKHEHKLDHAALETKFAEFAAKHAQAQEKRDFEEPSQGEFPPPPQGDKPPKEPKHEHKFPPPFPGFSKVKAHTDVGDVLLIL